MVRDIIMDAHEELNFPESYIAASILSATATAIGNSAILNIRDDWKEKCVLFIVLLGRSGTVKTPPMSFAYAPLLKLDCQSIQQYNKDMNDYLSSAEKNNEKRPKARQRIVKDCTLEAVAKVLSENPLGIVVLNDELKGWISSFDRYHKSGGGDMEQWMTLFNSEPIIVNRKGAAEVICVPSPDAGPASCITPPTTSPTLFTNCQADARQARTVRRQKGGITSSPGSFCRTSQMKKKNGRPPIDDILRRGYQVKATLNRQESRVLRMKLEQSGLKTADFLRALIICGEVKAPIPPEYRKMINNLYKLGQNVHYVVKHTSEENSSAFDAAYQKFLKEFDDILDEFHSMTRK